MKQPLEVEFKAQRHLRNRQLGDYFRDANGTEHFEIASTGDYLSDVAILVHELVEQALCRERGVPEQSIDLFDDRFQGAGEPGDDPKAPYHREHILATRIEKMMIKAAGRRWKDYEKALDRVIGGR